jgi:hypothetical protein
MKTLRTGAAAILAMADIYRQTKDLPDGTRLN